MIRIGNLSDDNGDIDFCLNSYFPFGTPGSSCQEAIVLCDSKKKVYVPSMEDLIEPPFTTSICNSDKIISNETWYKWRADSDSPISFTITPFLLENNIDFEVYRINDGIEGCDLELLRCESAVNGSTNGCDAATGLKEGISQTFTSEFCDDIHGSYLTPIDGVRDEIYAIRILSRSQNAGFVLEFGKNMQFFNTIGQGFGSVLSQVGTCDFQIKYSANGFSVPPQSYNWDIGLNASSEDELSDRIISLTTSEFGTHNVQVSFEISYGCIVTEIDSTCVLKRLSSSSFGIVIDSIKGIKCDEQGGSYLAINTEVRCPELEMLTYSIDGGPFTMQKIFTDLSLGEHEIRAKLNDECEISKIINIEEEVAFDGMINAYAINKSDCLNNYEFSIELSGELLGSETVFWDFGPGSSPSTAEGEGPYEVTFEGFGFKEISANISANTECSKEVDYLLAIDRCVETLSPEILISGITEANCSNKNGAFELEVNGGCGPFTFFLDTIAISPPFVENLSSGTYKIRVIDKDSCITEEVIEITRKPDLEINAGSDITVSSAGTLVPLSLSYNYPDVTISSNSPNIICEDPLTCTRSSLLASESETIIFTVVNPEGCLAFDTIDVSLQFEATELLYVPNIFSPNGDGVNDVFEIYIPENYTIQIKMVEIFDRWGNKVLQTINSEQVTNSLELWDGKIGSNEDTESAVFLCVATFIVRDGEIEKEVSISQSITTMR